MLMRRFIFFSFLLDKSIDQYLWTFFVHIDVIAYKFIPRAIWMEMGRLDGLLSIGILFPHL